MLRDSPQSRIVLDILESVDQDGERSQRKRASEVGVALGLINAYLKFCIRKGYLKARKVSPRTYRYILTPKGFAEKSRLTLSRLSSSLDFLRATRAEYSELFKRAESLGWRNMVIVNASPLAEVCTICALEHGIKILGIVDAHGSLDHMLGIPLHTNFESIDQSVDGAVIADLHTPAQSAAWAQSCLGAERVLIPKFLGVLPDRAGAAR